MPIYYIPTVSFVARRVRPAVRRLLRLRRIVEEIQSEYWVHHQSVLDSGSNELVADGAPTNGLPPVTGGQAMAVVGKLIEKIITGISADDLNVLLTANVYDDVSGID